MKIKKIALLSALLFFTFGFIQTVSAEGLRASPFRIEETVQPGETITSFITITNVSGQTNTFYGEVRDFVPRGEGGEARLIFDEDSKMQNSLSDWVSLPTDEVRMGPGERREIPISFEVPEDASPGGYYGAIVFGPDSGEVEEGEGAVVSLARQVGVLALFQVEGEVDETARIREFRTDQSIYNAPFNVEFVTRLENLGNVHIKPIGSIKVENIFGQEVATKQVNPPGGNVLPETIRRFENSWEDEFGFGRYDATLSLSFGTPPDQGGAGIQTAVMTTGFWILPVRLIAGIIIGLILIGSILIFLFIQQKEKAVKRAIEETGGDPKAIRKNDSSQKIFILIVVIIITLVLLITGTIIFLLLG